MEVSIRKSDLVRELQLVQGIVERKTSIPVLSNVLVEAKGAELKLAATDLDVSLRCGCPAVVKREGAVTLAAKKLYEIVRMLPDSDVQMKQLPDAWVAIECERSSFKMAGLPREDYPALPEPKGRKGVEIPAAALKDLIARTAFAITAEDARYYLAGALLILEKDGVGMVATDGHRLAFAQRRVALKGAEAGGRVLVPRKAIHELARLLDGDDGVLFQESDNHLLFSVAGRTLASKTIEGQFPAYEKVVAVAADKHAGLDREQFAMAIRRVSLLSSERSRAVKLALQNGRLELQASAPELGEAHESLPADYKGDPVEIGFNAQYLLDFLAAAGSEAVTLDVKDAESQGMLKPKGEAETDYRYVVMPMRL